MTTSGKRAILAMGRGNHEWRGLRLVHDSVRGWLAGVACTFGEGYSGQVHGHYLAPDATQPGQYILATTPHYWPTQQAAQSALDAWEAQPEDSASSSGANP